MMHFDVFATICTASLLLHVPILAFSQITDGAGQSTAGIRSFWINASDTHGNYEYAPYGVSLP